MGATAPGRRDLRFKPQMPTADSDSEVETFRALPVGDLWEDAGLLDCLEYLMNSKRVRPGLKCSMSFLVKGNVLFLLEGFLPSGWMS